MENVKLKYKALKNALTSLEESLKHFEDIKKLPADLNLYNLNFDRLYLSARDSVIQRFEFTVELFWKYLKLYLKEIKDVSLSSSGPSDIVRESCRIGLINQNDARQIINMIKSRNITSHIYKEEIAEQISKFIPNNFAIIKNYVEKIKI